MNLEQMRERVCNELAWAPTTTAFKNDVANVINDHYQYVMNEDAWTFRVVESSLRAYADEAVASVTVNATATDGVTNNAGSWPYRHMDGLLYQPTDEADSIRRWGRIAGVHDLDWQQLTNRSLLDNSWAQGGFPDPDQASTIANPVFLEVNPVYAAQVGTFTNMYVRHDRYQLPYDCAEILAINNRDDRDGSLAFVNRQAERGLLSPMDPPGKPRAWLLDDYVDAGRSPVSAPAAEVSSGGGSLPTGTYRYFYAFYYRGCFSGVSPTVTATISSGSTNRVLLTAMDASRDERYGRSKILFRETGDGIFYYRATITDANTTYTDTSTVKGANDLRWDDRMAQKRMAIRLYPRPSADMWLNVQYLRMPNRLVAQSDVPEMPEECHRLLVHLTVAQFAARQDGQDRIIKYHQQQAAEVKSQMISRYINQYATKQKAAWSPTQFRFRGPSNPASMS